LVCAPAPFHDFVARTLNVGEESLLSVCGGVKMAPPHPPGLGVIPIAPGPYPGWGGQSTRQQEGGDERPPPVASRSPRNPPPHHKPNDYYHHGGRIVYIFSFASHASHHSPTDKQLAGLGVVLGLYTTLTILGWRSSFENTSWSKLVVSCA